jgi:serine/arginine repetitive matrix protein 1
MKGTSYEQDSRFADKTKKMLEMSQWPDKYSIKIDLDKVDLDLIKSWA